MIGCVLLLVAVSQVRVACPAQGIQDTCLQLQEPTCTLTHLSRTALARTGFVCVSGCATKSDREMMGDSSCRIRVSRAIQHPTKNPTKPPPGLPAAGSSCRLLLLLAAFRLLPGSAAAKSNGSQGMQVVSVQGVREACCAVQVTRSLQQESVLTYLWLQLLTDLHHHNRQSPGDSSGAEALLLPALLLDVVSVGQVGESCQPAAACCTRLQA